jgi:amino acid adenylation domain-containing protein
MDDREFWGSVIGAGSVGAVPRWSADPAPGPGPVRTAEVAVPVPAALDRAVADRADAVGAPGAIVLLAAHARVAAALAGEDDVVVGLVDDGDPRRSVPCRLDTAAVSWRALLTDVARREAEVRRRALVRPDVLAALRHAADPLVPWTETALDVAGPTACLPDDAVVGVGRDADRLVVRYRPGVLDADAARRIAGYHLAALAAFAADPDAAPADADLLDAAERHHQVHELAGPAVDLPDRRAHDLVADRVRAHPDRVALTDGTRAWTYRELDDHADRVGRALLARGLTAEAVVAVVSDRTLEWGAAVLGVLRAGGVYLPVDPHYPAERIRTVLERADCAVVLHPPEAGPGLTAALAARPTPTIVLDERLPADPDRLPGDGLDVAVGADQLAYVYFTSGSTGTPKGAMCEHAGLLNHLLAKIADLGIDDGSVVAQTASQCFDISLWQLLAALLTGGTTTVVEQELILDVPRFVEAVRDRGVTVLQLVPSYLDVVLTHLASGVPVPPALRVVTVTGEAVRRELVVRWFELVAGVPLVNAYGLTETSDDTNHAVLHAPPATARVPLGPAVGNVLVLVVDRLLRPVPLGAPGEIVFAGVCVGRGYVNDPGRTAAAFVDDPYRGGRLYRSGDRGRWLPGGDLEFLGRRDAQVKLSGFRIELGEVENALLAAPGVRDGAVVVVETPARGRHLAGFWVGEGPDDEAVRAALRRTLPGYMVPAALHHRADLPRTANGKTDTAALARLGADLEAAPTAVEEPRTEAERRVAAAWSTVLGVGTDVIGRRDDFFDRGGTSLAAVKVALRLGRALTLPEVVERPVLADLAALLETRLPDLAPA